MHALTAVGRALRRLMLALRYYHRLGYTWRVAWVKAAR